MKRITTSPAMARVARLTILALLAPTCWAGSTTLIPPDEAVQTALQHTPTWQARLAQAQAEQRQADQLGAGPGEWTATVQGDRRTYRDASLGEAPVREWSASLSRVVRLPSQARSDQTAADATRNWSQAQNALAWRDLLQGALEAHTAWLKAVRTEQLWQNQLQLVQTLTQATVRRHALGDAAHMDAVQAQALLTQTQAQSTQAQQQRQALERSLLARFPGWPLPSPSTWPADSWPDVQNAMATVPTTWSSAQAEQQLPNWPEVRVATAQSRLSEALALQSDAALAGNPSVGVQTGQDRSGAERVLGLNLSWPFGHTGRAYGAQALKLQAQAALQQEQATRSQAEAALRQHWQDTQDSLARWQLARDAQFKLDTVATALDKGYRLGEGQLADVLQARRLAKEQALQTAQAEADTWLALWRWQAEQTGRWRGPESD